MLNNFKHLFFITIFLTALFTGLHAFATNNSITVVYPKNNAKIYANSTFFIGHTNPKATLSINDIPVKIYPNGSFVKVYNLNNGENSIVLKSVLNNETKTQCLNITRATTTQNATVTKPILKPLDENLIVTENEAPIRITPYGDRLTPTKKGVIFHTVGYINNHYKILLSNNKYAYIGQSTVQKYVGEKILQQTLQNIEFIGKEKDLIIKIPTEQPIPIEITNTDNTLKVKLYGTKLDFKNYLIKSPYITDFNFENDTFNISILTDTLNGYDYFYDDNNLIIKIRTPFTAGLYGKIIAIDPGHGGKECGSIGPTEIPEKNINLEISKYLKHELEKNGAKVIMTRNNDTFVDLYERVDIAKAADADVLISIHNNALPDGQNPYEIHGTTTYYYQPQAEKLAKIIQKNLLVKTGFLNQGIKKGSFVLTRPTYPISLLIEVGFMINPIEYEQLLLPKNQKAYAIGITNGLKEYFH